MTSTRHARPGSTKAIAPLLISAVVMLASSAPSARAGELKVPQEKPEVVMDIPDGWTTEWSRSGFEMRAPEKNAIVVGRMIGRDRKALDTWRDEAATKLKAFGIAFDPNAKAPANQAAPKKPEDGTSAFTTDPNKFTFSGAPSLKEPGEAGSNNPVKPGLNSVENLTKGEPTQPETPMPKLPFKAVQIYGATLNGKPVDVQLVLYSLTDNRMFVMMQESGPDDGRTVAMAQSVRAAEASGAPKDDKASDAKPNDAKPNDAKAKDDKKDAKAEDTKSKDAADTKPKSGKKNTKKHTKPKSTKPQDTAPADDQPQDGRPPNND